MDNFTPHYDANGVFLGVTLHATKYSPGHPIADLWKHRASWKRTAKRWRKEAFFNCDAYQSAQDTMLNEIKRLEAENQRLRHGLRRLASGEVYYPDHFAADIVNGMDVAEAIDTDAASALGISS